MRIIDFYTGFEGEAELQFIERDSKHNTHSVLVMWDGYFNDIMHAMKPNESGYWEAVTLEFHMHSGWYDRDEWPCDDPNNFLNQLLAVKEINLGISTREVYNVLVDFVKKTIERKHLLYIKYD